MKNFFKMATLLVAVLFMVGCDGDDDPLGTATPVAPVVSVVASPDSFESGDTLALGASITLTGLSDGGAAIASYAVNRDGVDLGSANVTTTITSFTIPTKPTVTNNNASDSLRGKVNIYNFMTTDVNGKSGSKAFSVYFADSTALSSDSTFTWFRQGGTPATGLSKFGLEWTQNSNAPFKAIVKKTGTNKLVLLTSAQYGSITTKERLKEVIDAANGVDDYRGVSASADGTYNDVLGTKVGDNYFLINVRKGTVVVVGTAPNTRTDITIEGNFKR